MNPTIQPALEVSHLTVSDGQRSLVRDVSITIERSERVALVGASGSGKSLTAGAITGLLPALMSRSGEISAAGSTALIRQDSSTSLNPLVRVERQLQIPLSRRPPAEGSTRSIVALLSAVGLDDPERILRSYSAELSGGERQRVCIALAMACRPSVLVADEPTTALDVVSQALVLDALRHACDSTGAGLLLITHDLAVAAQVCTRILVLHEGHIVDGGSLEDLRTASTHLYTRALLEASGVRR